MKKYSDKPLSYNELISFENLLKAHMVARLGKRHKEEIIKYELNLFYNLTKLHNQLKDKKYKINGYKKFYIYEPKKREIQCLSYKDRIVQHSICDNFLTPYFRNRLILCNCACQENKGTYFARQKLKEFFVNFYKKYKNNGYILKCDIHKYFASINHDVLKQKLKKIKDKDIFDVLCKIIDSYNNKSGVGLPIGNQISQIMGVAFLDELDRLIKEKLKIKFYVRYMDDLILLHHDRVYLQYCLKEIKKCLNNLKLKFNEKTQIIPIKNGVEFLGGRYSYSNSGKVIIKVKKKSRQKFVKNLKAIKYLKNENLIDEYYIQTSLAGYKGHFKGFNAFNLSSRINNIV